MKGKEYKGKSIQIISQETGENVYLVFISAKYLSLI